MMGSFSMRCSLIAVVFVALILVHGVAVEAQGPTFKLGTTPTEGELQPADAAIGPDGEGLPPGQGHRGGGRDNLHRPRLCQVPRVNRLRGPRSRTGWAPGRV